MSVRGFLRQRRYRLRWRRSKAPDWWEAKGVDGVWSINRVSPQLYGVHFPGWDSADWMRSTLDEAKALVDELDGAPPAHSPPTQDEIDAQVVDLPREESFDVFTNAPPPGLKCPCATDEPPQLVKPIRLTAQWWMDPAARWRCPACLSELGDYDGP